MTARLGSGLLGLGLLVGALGCREAGPTVEISARRTATRPSSLVVPGASARARFAPREAEADHKEDQGASSDLIAYDLPSGWVALAPTGERMVNLRPAGDPEASCYLSFLPGSANGLAANVNRWRSQFGADPLSGAEVAALPTRPLLGREATLVEVEGNFAGMGGAPARAGFKLLGLAVSEPSGSLFLKFTAPAGLVELEREHFLAFASSLRLAEGGGEARAAEVGPEHGDVPDTIQDGPLRWVVPMGWVVQPRRPMREVTFKLPAGAECYVTRLSADAGGLRANLDRWCDQFGRVALTNDAFAALERVEMMGQRVPVLALEGSFTGMDGAARDAQGLLGVACIRAEDSLFVKLTGPAAVVRTERANFLAFVQSLEDAQ
jgi:hypothetical protein